MDGLTSRTTAASRRSGFQIVKNFQIVREAGMKMCAENLGGRAGFGGAQFDRGA